MCEYCKERGLKEPLVVDELAILSIKKKKILGFCLEIDLKDLTEHLISTNINYCPMCGRKLGK